MHTNNILYSIRMSGDFADVLKKHKLSGTINSATDTPKTVLVYNRPDGEIIATTMREESDGSFELYLPFRSDEGLTAMCRDEGGDFNADIYDRLSLCTVTHEMLSEHNSLVKPEFIDINETIHINYTNDFLPVPHDFIPEELIGNITKIELSDGDITFKDSGDLEVTLDSEDSLRVNDNSIILSTPHNSIIRGGGNNKSDVYEDGIIHDIFGDGSAELTMPFDGRIHDLGGRYSISSAEDRIKFYDTEEYGVMLHQNAIPTFDSRYVLNFGFQENVEYTMSFLFKPDFNAGSNQYLFQGRNGIQMYFDAYFTRLYFSTANYDLSWNAVKNWYNSTAWKPGNIYHITMTFNNGFYSLYINGALISSQAGLNINPNNSANYDKSLNTQMLCNEGTTSYWPYAGIKMLRIFSKICSPAEITQLYNEAIDTTRELVVDVSKIHASSYYDGKLSLNGSKIDKSIDIPSNRGFSDVSGSGANVSVDGISVDDDSVNFVGNSVIHKADTKIDLVGGNSHGSESNMDIFCKTVINNKVNKQVIWKSGDSLNGLAVGIDSNNIGIFGRSAGTKTSIEVSTASLTEGKEYSFHYSNGAIKVYDKIGQEVLNATGTITAADATEQESVGAAADGSPLTDGSVGGDSPTDFFNGSVKNIETFSGGTLKISTEGELRVAAEVGTTGVQCKVRVEKWDADGDECIVWVNVPQILNNADTDVRIYFDINHYDNPYVEYTGVAPSLPGDATQDEIDFRASLDADTVIQYSTDITEEPDELLITVPANTISEDVNDFPLRIELTDNSGIGGYDASDVFTNNATFEKITVFDEDKNKLFAEVSKWQQTRGGILTSEYNKFNLTIINALYLNTNYYPWFSINRSLPLTGTYVNNQWLGVHGGGKLRMNIVNTSGKVIDKIRMINSHHDGAETDTGIKNFTIYGSNNHRDFESLNPDNTDEIEQLGVFLAQETNPADVENWQVFNLVSTIVYKYIIFVFDDNYGDPNYFGVRRIEFDYDSREEASGTYNSKATVQPTLDVAHCVATSIYSAGYEAWRAFDPNVDVGSTNTINNSWTSSSGQSTNQKINVDLGSAKLITNLAMDNGHNATNPSTAGIQNFSVYGTNSATAFNNTDAADLTDLTLLGTFVADQHPQVGVGWTQNFSLPGTVAFRYYVLVASDNYGGAFMSIKRLEYQEDINVSGPDGKPKKDFYPSEFSFSKVVASSNYNTNYEVYYAFDPSTPRIGVSEGASWLGASATSTTPRRINVDYDNPIVATCVEIDNYHHSSSYSDRGIKEFSLYGTNSASAFAETDPSVLTDLVFIERLRPQQHLASNVSDPELLFFENDTAYRYYVIIAHQTHGNAIMGVRKLILKESYPVSEIPPIGVIYTKVPIIYATKDTNIVISYDSSNTDNSAYIGATGSTQAQNVWDSNFLAVYHLENIIDVSAQYGVLDSTSNAHHLNMYGYFDFDENRQSITFGNGRLYSDNFNEPITALTTEMYFDATSFKASYDIPFCSDGVNATAGFCCFIYSSGNTSYGSPWFAFGSWAGAITDFENMNFLSFRFSEIINRYANTTMYLNNSNYGFQNCGVSDSTMTNIVIGAGPDQQSPWGSNIKELRYSQTFRSDSWERLTNLSIEDNASTVKKNESILILNPLPGWENGKGVIATIPSGSIASNTNDFDVPIRINLSSGTNNYDFSTWLAKMMETFYPTGTYINKYMFGGQDCISKFNIEGVAYKDGPYLNKNGCIAFDGSGTDIIDVNNVNTVGVNQNGFTFAAWLRASTDVADHPANQYHGVLGTKTGVGLFDISLYNRNIYLYWSNGANRNSVNFTNFFDGTFNHVAIRLYNLDYISDQVDVDLFVNGKLVTSTVNTSYAPKGSSDSILVLGGNSNHSTRWFTGEISDLVMMDHALSHDEIYELYMSRVPHTYISDEYVTSLFNCNETIFNPMIGEDLENIVTNDNKAEDTNYMLTFDDESYCIFNGTTWDKVVSNSDAIHGNTGSSNWHHIDVFGDWHDGGTNLNKVLSIASKSFKMNYKDVEAITRGQFDLIYDKTNGICNFAISMKSSSKNLNPSVGNILYNSKKYWVSKLYDLDGITISTTRVHWTIAHYDDIDYNQFIKVYVKLDNDADWTECVNGISIPVLYVGMDTTGRSMKFKVVWDFSSNPEFNSLFDSRDLILNVEV